MAALVANGAAAPARSAQIASARSHAVDSPHSAEPAGYWTGDVDAPVPAALRGGSVIGAPALAALLQAAAVVVVDVADAPRRPPELAPGAPWLPLPHPGIPGALWIPGAGDGSIEPATEAFFRNTLARATAGVWTTPVVVYCHARCWLSWNAAKRAVSYGYTRVSWYPGGIEGWTARKQRPTTPATPLLPAP